MDESGQHFMVIEKGELEVTFIDNTASDEYRAGYNGIATLSSEQQKDTVFVPTYAGLNLEHEIRFSQSPTGGGDRNPAWDFQFIIRSFEINKDYSYRARIVYKPFLSPEDVMNETLNWINI